MPLIKKYRSFSVKYLATSALSIESHQVVIISYIYDLGAGKRSHISCDCLPPPIYTKFDVKQRYIHTYIDTGVNEKFDDVFIS